MTIEENEKLTLQCRELMAIFDEVKPVKNDGTYKAELVQQVTEKMIDYIIEDNDKAAALKQWMTSHEFWTSPASTRFHGNSKGGLAAHSLLVAYQALYFAPLFAQNFLNSKQSANFSFSAFDVFIAAIAHDFCKAGTYMTEYKKTKDYQGNMVYSSYYKTKPSSRNLGHGNESVLLLLESLPELIQKRYVIEAISRHMGFSDISDMEKMNYSNFLQNPLVILIQTADQTAAGWYDI